MDSDLAWVNGKSGRQSWRYVDAFQRSIISEAIYHFPFLMDVLLWRLDGGRARRSRLHPADVGGPLRQLLRGSHTAGRGTCLSQPPWRRISQNSRWMGATFFLSTTSCFAVVWMIFMSLLMVWCNSCMWKTFSVGVAALGFRSSGCIVPPHLRNWPRHHSFWSCGSTDLNFNYLSI